MKNEPKILGFLCHWCCYAAADAAGVGRLQYPPNIRTIRVMCTGRIEPAFLLAGFANGASGIFTGGWHLGECHYRSGNYEAISKFTLMKILLEQLGLDQGRLALEWVSAAEAPVFVQKITSFTDRIRGLGQLGEKEGLDPVRLVRKIAAARVVLEGMKMRSAFARQAKKVKETKSYGEFPDPEKLRTSLEGEITLQEVFLCIKEEKGTAAELAARLNLSEDQVSKAMETLQKKKMVNADFSIA